jgi:hypothetical protein
MGARGPYCNAALDPLRAPKRLPGRLVTQRKSPGQAAALLWGLLPQTCRRRGSKSRVFARLRLDVEVLKVPAPVYNSGPFK